MRRRSPKILIALVLALPAACGGKVFIDGEPAAGTGGAGGSSSSSSAVSSVVSSSSGAGGELDAGPDGPPLPPPPVAVYAHSGDTLYLLDPNTKAVSVIGKFKGGCASIVDLA